MSSNMSSRAWRNGTWLVSPCAVLLESRSSCTEQERNEQYVVQVETHLARLLNVDGGRLEEDNLKLVKHYHIVCLLLTG